MNLTKLQLFYNCDTSLFKGSSPARQVLPPVRASAPPPTEQRGEVIQAKRDSRRQNLKKKGYAATILAGETGGFGGNRAGDFHRQIEDGQTSAAGRTLLGGGA